MNVSNSQIHSYLSGRILILREKLASFSAVNFSISTCSSFSLLLWTGFFALILISCNCLYFQSLFLHHWILSDQSLDRSKWLPALHLKVRDDLLYYLWCSPSVLSSDRRNNLDHIYICRLICLVNYQKTLEASMLNSLNSLGVPLDPLGTHRHSLYPLFFKHIIWI